MRCPARFNTGLSTKSNSIISEKKEKAVPKQKTTENASEYPVHTSSIMK
jgi:hypothetical protein